MSKADGSVIIDTRMDTSGFQRGVTNMQSGVTNIKKGFDGIGSALGKLAKVMIGIFAVKQLVQFGKEAIELGSNLSEVQNVVDVTFENLNEEINDFAKNAIEQFGLSETAAKQYTSTMGAMLKSMGFTTREAADMGMAMTGLAADMASFYNLRAEDAFYKIRAGISGETEPLKQLGINMSVANLEQYALTQGITKSYNAMTQQEQALLRYNYLLSVTADAQGDFSRTSESWANQTRILSEQFNALKATIGQGLINVFTPVLKLLNALLARLQTVANAFKAFTELITRNKASAGSGGGATAISADDYTAATDGAENYADATEEVADATKKAAKETKKYLSGIDEIKRFEEPEADASGSGGGSGFSGGGLSGGGLSVDYGNLAEGETVIDKVTDSFDKLLKMFAPLKSAWAEYGESIKTTLGKIGKHFADFGSQIASSTYSWFSHLNWEPFMQSVDGLLKKLQPLVNLILGGLNWAYQNVILPIGKWVVEEAAPASLDLLSAAFDALYDVLVLVKPLLQWLWDNILKPLGEWTGDLVITAIKTLTEKLKDFDTAVEDIQKSQLYQEFLDGLDLLSDTADKIKAGFKELSDTILPDLKAAFDDLNDTLKPLYDLLNFAFLKIYQGWVKPALKWLNEKIPEITQSLKDFYDKVLKPLGSFLSSILKPAFDNLVWVLGLLFNNVLFPLGNFIGGVFAAAWETLNTFFQNVLIPVINKVISVFQFLWDNVLYPIVNFISETLKPVFEGAFKSIKETIERLQNILVGILNFINNVLKGDWKSAWESIKSIFLNIWDGIVSGVKKPINLIIGIINSLISGIVNGMNGVIRALNTISINIPGWVPFMGGKHFGINLNQITAPQIPYLAKGAVIPPNAPFMAVLGDQKRGTNVEAPLSTIEQAVKNAMAQSNQSFNGTIRIPIILNGRQIYEAVIDQAQLILGQSGQNPFELA